MSKFLKVLVNIILILSIIVAGGLLIPPFAGVTTVIVDDSELDTNLSMGSVTYAVSLKGTPKEGSKVLVSEGESQYVYKVQSVNGEVCTLEDKLSTDGGTMEHTVSSTMKKAVLTVPFVGYVSMALRSTEGLIIVGLSVVFIVVLFILAEIWKKDDEDEDDEEDEEETLEDEESEEEIQISKRELKKQQKAEKKAEAARIKAEEKAAKKASKKKSGKKQTEEEETGEQSVSVEKVNVSGEDQNLFEETENILAADIAQMMSDGDSAAEEEDLEQPDMGNAMEEAAAAEEGSYFAIPSYTKEELIDKAKAAGDEPDVVEDEVSGVTLLDYSDIL